VQVDNHTGVELLCCFDHGNAKQDGSIGSWESGAFLIRYIQNIHLPACSTVCSLFSSFLAFSNGVNKKHRNFVVQKSFVQLLIVSFGQAHKITKGLDIGSGGIISEHLLTKRRNYIISCASVTSRSWCTSYSYSLGIG
jgi:hypothetical protein